MILDKNKLLLWTSPEGTTYPNIGSKPYGSKARSPEGTIYRNIGRKPYGRRIVLKLEALKGRHKKYRIGYVAPSGLRVWFIIAIFLGLTP